MNGYRVLIALMFGGYAGLAGPGVSGDGTVRMGPSAASAQSPQFRGGPNPTGVVDTWLGERFGGVAWRFETGGAVRSTAALADGTLYVGSSDGWLYALDAEDGTVEWRYDAGTSIASAPAVAGDVVLVGDRAGVLHGVRRATGAGRWRLETGPEVALPWGREGWDYFQASTTIAGGTAYWGSGDGNLYAVDPATGDEKWRFETGGRIRSTPAVAEGRLVFGSGDGFVYALDPGTGEEIWRFRTAGVDLNAEDFGYDRRQISASPTIVDGVVYIGSRDASLYALDAATGDSLWSFEDDTSWVILSAAVTGDRVYSGRSSNTNLRALDRTGAEMWVTATGGPVFASPVVAGETIVVGQGDGDLSAYDSHTGEERWSYRTGGGIWATPVVHDGRIYVGSDDGFVYAFETSDVGVERAVFFDEGLMSHAAYGGDESHKVMRDFFTGRGYDLLEEDDLVDFLDTRPADGGGAVVVFAMDAAPAAAIGGGTGSPLRRFMERGGKVVWLGYLPGYLARDSAGNVTGVDTAAAEELLDVDLSVWHGDLHDVQPTEAGRRWGLTSNWVGQGQTDPDAVDEVLALDEVGRAVAWVRTYGGPPGSGFVQARASLSPALLWQVLQVAEHGVIAGDRR